MTKSAKRPSGRVGYKSPPVETRFKKGQSGNPKGRPKGAKGFLTELREELDETILVHEGKNTRRLTKRRVIAKRLVEGGLRGDPKAIHAIARVDEQAQHAPDPRDPVTTSAEDDAILERFLARGSRNQAGGRKSNVK